MSVLKNQFEGGGGGGSDQLLDPDVPTLASQDKLKVSPKGLPFVMFPSLHGLFLSSRRKPNASQTATVRKIVGTEPEDRAVGGCPGLLPKQLCAATQTARNRSGGGGAVGPV